VVSQLTVLCMILIVYQLRQHLLQEARPRCPVPVLINCPLPAWARRHEEVDDQDLDQQAREFAERF